MNELIRQLSMIDSRLGRIENALEIQEIPLPEPEITKPKNGGIPIPECPGGLWVELPEVEQ